MSVQASQSGRRGRAGESRRMGRLYLAAFALFLAVYGLTSQRGPSWQDGGMFQWRILNFDLVGRLGLALSHPTLIAVGKVFSWIPLGRLAWRLNMVSAVFGAIAVANVTLLVRRLVPDRPLAAWVAGGVLGVAHTMWWLATMCECQTMFLAFFTLELNLLVWLVRRPRIWVAGLLGLASGLAWATHNFALLALPAYGLIVLGLCVRRSLKWRALALMIACWLVGAAPLLWLMAQQAAGGGIVAAVDSALFGGGYHGSVLALRARSVMMGGGYVLYNFPNLALPLMLVGLWRMRGKLPLALTCALGWFALIYFVFAIRYDVPDQFSFFLPFYAMVAVLAGLGLGWLRREDTRRRVGRAAAITIVITPLVYLVAPMVWKALDLPIPGRKDLLHRDPVSYWQQPWKHFEDSADRFARDALNEVPRGSTILADSTAYHPLKWQQRVAGLRADVNVRPLGYATPESMPVGTENVFVVSDLPGYFPRWLGKVATLRRDRDNGEVLFSVVWNEGRGPEPDDPEGQP